MVKRKGNKEIICRSVGELEEVYLPEKCRRDRIDTAMKDPGKFASLLSEDMIKRIRRKS